MMLSAAESPASLPPPETEEQGPLRRCVVTRERLPKEMLVRLVAGPEGTLVMPSMCDDDDAPFDRASASCRALGIVADTFWRMPGRPAQR